MFDQSRHIPAHPGQALSEGEWLLAAKEQRIKTLEGENRKLKEELKATYGKLYEQV